MWLTGDDPVFGPLADADVWECPQLLDIDGSWVLLLSIWRAGVQPSWRANLRGTGVKGKGWSVMARAVNRIGSL